jgi:hypothetical protein
MKWTELVPGLQHNCEPEPPPDGCSRDRHLRKYTIGTVLTFRQYDAEEVGHLGASHTYTFRRGDKLVVAENNACGMGIDVKRIRDGRIDMVWPTEVDISRDQRLPDGFDLSSPRELFPEKHLKEA